MIKAQGGYASDYRLDHNVCTVVQASDADFENGSVNLLGRSTNVHGRNAMNTDVQRQECVKRDERHHTEVRWSKYGGFQSSLGIDESARRGRRFLSVHTSWFSPSLSHTSKKNEVNCSSDKGTEFILMRSRTATR